MGPGGSDGPLGRENFPGSRGGSGGVGAMSEEKGSKLEGGSGAQPMLSDEELVEQLERLKVSSLI